MFPAQSLSQLDSDAIKKSAKQYDVRILRDTWGVPHIFGATDAAAAFGLAYAHCEDDFATIQEALLATRGQLAWVKGEESAPIDYMVNLFRVWEVVNDRYEKDLSPETRALCEAYATGVNLYAAQHRNKILKRGLFPTTGKDVVAGFVQKVPFFFFLQNTVRELYKPERRRPLSEKKTASNMEDLSVAAEFFTGGLPIGSNAFAVAPSRSADGCTRLAVNSHQPWSGPVTWYEAHMHSNEGMDIVGGTFPGAPIILHGHNRSLGWAHTVNFPDLTDVYVLEINPDNPNQYRFDGTWRDLEKRTVKIAVRVFGPVRWTVKREALWSVYGPVIRQPHGAYAIRYAGMGNIRQVEQWFRMGKANNFDEWMEAVRIRAIPSFNIVYADQHGNIYYLYNALFPKRAEGYDWKQYLPGNTSETLWTEYLPFEQLPQVKNPASGFLISCNNSPYHVTVGPENPNPEAFSPTLGIETHMTNRAVRALELFGADESITEDDYLTYKFDIAYSPNSPCGDLLKQVFELPPSDDPVVQEAVEILRGWDMRANVENTGTAIAVLVFEPIVRAHIFGNNPPDLAKLLKEKAHLLKDFYGRIDVPWGEINRLRRGNFDAPLCGGPDTLRAVYGHYTKGHIIADDGDSYILLPTWDKADAQGRHGPVRSCSIHQFGSATLDEKSPHYADQSPLFAACKFKPVWMDEADIRAHLEREYRPGEK